MLTAAEIKSAGYTHVVHYPRVPGAQSLPQSGAKSLSEARSIAKTECRSRNDLRRNDAWIALAWSGQFVEACGPSR